LALLTTVSNTVIESKNTVKGMTSAEQLVYTAMWSKLFKVPRKSSCSKTTMLKKVSRDVKAKIGAGPAGSPGGLAGPGGINGPVGSTRYSIKQAKFWWVKSWGYEAVAYFFDYLDPVIRKEVVAEFNAIMKDLKAFPVTDPKVPDPFDFKKLLAAGTANLSKEQVKMLKDFTSNYDAKVYDASANVPQIAAAVGKWKWRADAEDPTFFMRFVQKYDMNFDGKLGPREFTLASIYHNKQVAGTSLCTHCYSENWKNTRSDFLVSRLQQRRSAYSRGNLEQHLQHQKTQQQMEYLRLRKQPKHQNCCDQRLYSQELQDSGRLNYEI